MANILTPRTRDTSAYRGEPIPGMRDRASQVVAAIDDVALLFVGEHRIGGRRTVRPGR